MNPNIAKAGKSTRFGASMDATLAQKKASKPWSIRNAMRHFAAQRVEVDDIEDEEAVARAIDKVLPKNPTMAERGAIAAWKKAACGDMRALEFVTEQVDGKLAQPNLNADYAFIQEMSDNELEEYHTELMVTLENIKRGEERQ